MLEVGDRRARTIPAGQALYNADGDLCAFTSLPIRTGDVVGSHNTVSAGGYSLEPGESCEWLYDALVRASVGLRGKPGEQPADEDTYRRYGGYQEIPYLP